MKKTLSLLTITFLLFSCSSENSNAEKKGLDLLLGKWLFRYENDYDCKVQPGDKITTNSYDFYWIFSSNGVVSRQNENDDSRPFATIENVSEIDSEGNILATFTYLENSKPKQIVIKLYDNNQKMLFDSNGCSWLEFHKSD